MSLNRHGTRRGLPHVLIEMRQDLIATRMTPWQKAFAAPPGAGAGRRRSTRGAMSFSTGIAIPSRRARLHQTYRSTQNVRRFRAPNAAKISNSTPFMAWICNGVPKTMEDVAADMAPAHAEEKVDDQTQALEAAVFRRLVAHLRERSDVQNIDLMIAGGFCRNCLGDWYRDAAAEKGVALEKDEARALVYGMPPAEWKNKHQKEATPGTGIGGFRGFRKKQLTAKCPMRFRWSFFLFEIAIFIFLCLYDIAWMKASDHGAFFHATSRCDTAL